MDFGDNVIKRRTATKRIVAICATVVPREMNLIASAAARDQLGLINVVFVH